MHNDLIVSRLKKTQVSHLTLNIYFRCFPGLLTQKSNGQRVLVETVLTVLDHHSQVDVRFIVGGASDHEGTVPFVLVSDETGFASVSLQDQRVICVIDKCVFVKAVDVKLTSLVYFPVNLNVVGVELGRVGESARYDQVRARIPENLSCDINMPILTCVVKSNHVLYYDRPQPIELNKK